MRLRVLVDDADTPRDLFVDVGSEQQVADLATALAAHLGHQDATGLRRGDPPGPPLDPTTAVGDSGLRWGDRLVLTTGHDPAPHVPRVPLRQLVATGGPDAGRALPLPLGAHTVGRDGEADLTIDDPHLSRLHLRVDVGSSEVTVVDLGSSNGTRLDGEPLSSTPRPLRPDSVVVAGASVLRLRPPPPREGPVPARDGKVPFTRRPRVEPALPVPTVQLHQDDPEGPTGLLRGLLHRRRPAGVSGRPGVDVERQQALHPDPQVLLERARCLQPHLWERRPDDEDFLHVRLGWETGEHGVPVPVVIDLRDVGSLAIRCDDEHLRLAILRWQVAQLAGLCSPADLDLVPLGPTPNWAWTTWIPHTRSPVTAPQLPTPAERLEWLLGEVRGPRTRRRGALVAVVDGAADLDRSAIEALATEGPAAGVHVVLGGPTGARLPNVGATCTVEPTSGRALCTVARGDAMTVAGLDGVRPRTAVDLARATAGVRDVTGGGGKTPSVPPPVSLLELLGVTGPRPRRIAEWWADGDRPAPIGTDPDTTVALDVDRGAGHVLLAGDADGDRHGLLRVLTTAAATVRSPGRLQLLLVGPAVSRGALAPCHELPHVWAAGDADDDRVTQRLRAELEQRQQALPAPSTQQLVVVVDDVADVVRARPDVAELLEEAARADAAAGIVLVLSTARPAAVPDELRRHLTVRIALRLADRAASHTVLGNADATRLPPDAPGRGCLRRGHGGTVVFQTAAVDLAPGAGGDTGAIEVRDVVAGRVVTAGRTTTSVPSRPATGRSDLALLVEACRAASTATPDPAGVGGDHEPVPLQRTFLFSDVVRSTALVEAIGDEHWTRLVQWHDQAITGLVEAHGGEVVDHTGDGFFVAFTTPPPALRCAVEVQRMLRRHRREAGFAPDVRIGLHHTDVLYDGRYRGRGVHIAARIAALAEGGEVLASAATLELAPDVEVGATRTEQLRGVSTPVPVASVRFSE